MNWTRQTNKLRGFFYGRNLKRDADHHERDSCWHFELNRLKTLQTNLKALDKFGVKKWLSTTRLTGNSLYAIMKRFERNNPRLCAECRRQGRVRYGDELEHIVPLWQGGAESDSNREWICRDDHKIKTAREASMRRSGWVWMKGGGR